MPVGRPKIPEEKLKEILRLLDLGWTERHICESVNVGKGTINRVKKLVTK